MTIWLLLSLVIAILFVFLRRETLHYIYLASKIRGPSLWEFVTVHAKDFLSDALPESLCKICERYSYQPWGFWTMKGIFAVVLSDADSIEELYKNKNLYNKPDLFYGTMSELLGKGSLFLNGETWKRHRKAINPAFRKSVLEGNLDIMTDGAERLLEQIRKKANGSSIDMNPIIEFEMTDTVIRFATSDKLKYPNIQEMAETFHAGSELAQLKIVNPVYYGFLERFSRTFRDKKSRAVFVINQAKRLLLAIVENAISEMSSTSDKEPRDILECGLYFNLKSKLISDKDEIVDECVVITTAAIDATGAIVKSAILMLALHQDLQRRVLEELRNIFGSSEERPSPKDLDKMEFLEMFIKETMRLFPTGGIIAREASDDTSLNGILIPKGSTVLMFVKVLHRNPEYFKDPLKFDPERFTPGMSEKRHPYAYLPFGSGSRNCVGQLQAMMMMKVMLSSILREYKILPGEDLRSIDDVPVKMSFSFRISKTVVKLVSRGDIY